VKAELDTWLLAAGIVHGPFPLCAVPDRFGGRGISEKAVWHVVKQAVARMNLHRIAPHDLRRSCARLCHVAGGEQEQIQLLLGHATVQTTERYIGCNQRLRLTVNDRLGIEPG